MSYDVFSIASIRGNPSQNEIAALSASISVYFHTLSQSNPQNSLLIVHKSVDNLQGYVAITRTKSRNANECIGNRSSDSWSFIHRIRSR
jgi:hypothetical protein